jgi:hypothetical protein
MSFKITFKNNHNNRPNYITASVQLQFTNLNLYGDWIKLQLIPHSNSYYNILG